MYDIKIFIEENGQFGARVNAGKEIIYGLGNNQCDLMQNLKEGLELSFENKTKDRNTKKIFDYLSDNQKLCH